MKIRYTEGKRSGTVADVLPAAAERLINSGIAEKASGKTRATEESTSPEPTTKAAKTPAKKAASETK